MKWLFLLLELKNDNIFCVEINGSFERLFVIVYEMCIYNSVVWGSLDVCRLC